jgi:hypothetical protein
MTTYRQTVLARFTLGVLLLSLAAAPAAAAGDPTFNLPALHLESFAQVPPAKSLEVTPALQDTATTAAKAVNYKNVMQFLGVKLTESQKQFLNQNKFLLIPRRATRFQGKIPWDWHWGEMVDMFDAVGGPYAEAGRRPENARLVTPDVMLHTFHKFFENSLEYLEEHDLAPRLRRLLLRSQAKALQYRRQSQGPLAAHFEVVAAQLTVPLVLLNNARWPIPFEQRRRTARSEEDLKTKADITETLPGALQRLQKYRRWFSPPVYARMVQEITYIYQADGMAVSPLYGQYHPEMALKTDYTQYTPRSHYTKSSLLRGYFRAMMYLGRNSYLLQTPAGITDALLVAVVLASPGDGGQPLLSEWQKIMEITTYYAGAPDDICYPEWRNYVVKVLGTAKFAASEAVNPEVVAKLSAHLTELRPPAILADAIVSPGVPDTAKGELLAATRAFRIFGQRFTFDAWVLNRLSAGAEKSEGRLPSTPSALFIPAALGDQGAWDFSRQYLARLKPPFAPAQVDGFSAQLAKVAADLKKVKQEEWFASMGSAWLKLLQTLSGTFGSGYPLYMQGQLFPVKQLQTFLGSYTELKHDTLLYAKQSFAEAGDGFDEKKIPPVPRGFVEPNLPFWQGLQRLVAYTAAGFKKYGIFKKELEDYGRLTQLKNAVDFYTGLAVKELQGTPLTAKEYEKLRTTNLSNITSPLVEGALLEEAEKRAALIADVHTDALKEQVLYEATGEPYFILALVGNEGVSRLTVGVAYNHYEFTGPLASRYTDAQWQARVYGSPPQLPPKNFWYEGLMVK